MVTSSRSDDRAAAEAYRILRSTVKFSSGESAVRSTLIVDIDRDTSSGVAEELARAFAHSGDDCVYINANLRDAVPTEPGFGDLIVGTASASAVAKAADVAGLSVVGAGSQNDPDLIAGDSVRAAIDALLANHAYAILAAAPMPRFGDALAIAPRVDATILVVTAGQTRRPRAIEAREALDRVGARLLGVVMIENRRRFW